MENSFDSVQDYYENKYSENDRMVRRPLEFSRCKEIISRYLLSRKMEIADIGGATGPFSYWLSEMNHNVHLLDYTPLHIEQAKENGARKGISLASCECGDARQLPFRDNQFDLVLEMGPLYHLQSGDDRASCLSEARRVLKAGGIVICETISRYANIFDGFLKGLIEDKRFSALLDENLLTGMHSPGDTPYFTTAYFHTPEGIIRELENAGFSEVTVLPVEGFANAVDIDSYFENDIKRELLLRYIRKTENTPELLGVSAHLLAIGKKAE